MTDIKGIHPAAKIFPALEGDAFESLVASIRDDGQLHPIVVDRDGLVLDGCNRLAACKKAKVDPKTEPYDGDDPVGFIINANIHRRHLSQSQRALFAQQLANLSVGQPKKNPATLPDSLISQAAAASMLGVSERTVRDAKTVVEKGDTELIENVRNGKTTVSKAAKSLRQRKGDPVVRDGKKDLAERPRPPDPALPEPSGGNSSAKNSEPDDGNEFADDETPDVGDADVAADITDDQDTAVAKFLPALVGVDDDIAVVAVIKQYGLDKVFEVMKTFGEKEHGENTPWNVPIFELRSEIGLLKQELDETNAKLHRAEQSTTSPDDTLHAFKTAVLAEERIDWRAKADELLKLGINQRQYVDGNRPESNGAPGRPGAPNAETEIDRR